MPGWYYESLVRLHRTIVWIGWSTAAALTPWSRSVRLPAITLLVFLAVHIVFIPVDRYAYDMLPMLMLLTAHSAAGSLSLAAAAFRQAGRYAAARR